MSRGKEVAKAPPAGVPATYDYGEDAGAGFEGTKGSDLSVPFLSVLQSNSPQVEDNDPEGAKPGLLLNTVTKEMFEELPFLPCHKERAIVEWVLREKGGGFVGMHDPNGQVWKEAVERNEGSEFGKLFTPDGNQLTDTFYVYGLFLNTEGTETIGFGVISFSSTKIKPYRDWITAMYTLKGKPPMFANRAIMRTVKQKNDHGTFFNYRIDPFKETWAKSLIDPRELKPLIDEARDFREMVVSGMARADFSKQNTTGDGAGDAGDTGDAPF